jgi:C2 domain
VRHFFTIISYCLNLATGARGQRWSATPVNEPIFLSFSNSDTFHTWVALLRSYACPEVYGQRINAAEGGLYRMWRQIEVNCIQGRNLGVTRQFVDGIATGVPEGSQDADGADHDSFCEIYMNDMLCARTTARKGLVCVDWHEGFLISDLPPFENLEIIVFREKRMAKATVVGSVSIMLGNFRRGEYVEGWFPVLDNTSANVSIQVGELRLKLKVDE